MSLLVQKVNSGPLADAPLHTADPITVIDEMAPVTLAISVAVFVASVAYVSVIAVTVNGF